MRQRIQGVLVVIAKSLWGDRGPLDEERFTLRVFSVEFQKNIILQGKQKVIGTKKLQNTNFFKLNKGLQANFKKC